LDYTRLSVLFASIAFWKSSPPLPSDISGTGRIKFFLSSIQMQRSPLDYHSRIPCSTGSSSFPFNYWELDIAKRIIFRPYVGWDMFVLFSSVFSPGHTLPRIIYPLKKTGCQIEKMFDVKMERKMVLKVNEPGLTITVFYRPYVKRIRMTSK